MFMYSQTGISGIQAYDGYILTEKLEDTDGLKNGPIPLQHRYGMNSASGG